MAATVEKIAVTEDQAKVLITSGHFVTVTFFKRDNTIRVLNGRAGVAKHVNGKGMNYDPVKKRIIILYESNNEAEKPSNKYRAIRLESIVSFRANGKEYFVKR